MVDQPEDEPYTIQPDGTLVYPDPESGLLPAQVGDVIIGPNGGGYGAPL